MNRQHINVIAKKITKIMAENEASVDDFYEILKLVKKNLIVTAVEPFSVGCTSYKHDILVKDIPYNDGRIGDE